MTISTRLYTLFCGECVGEDEFGNRYYQQRRKPASGRVRRWVMYKGKAEASKVPARWHRWLHYTTEQTPKDNRPAYKWEKQHLPNLSGTQYAYAPKGSLRQGGKRYRVSGDYEAWKP